MILTSGSKFSYLFHTLIVKNACLLTIFTELVYTLNPLINRSRVLNSFTLSEDEKGSSEPLLPFWYAFDWCEMNPTVEPTQTKIDFLKRRYRVFLLLFSRVFQQMALAAELVNLMNIDDQRFYDGIHRNTDQHAKDARDTPSPDQH